MTADDRIPILVVDDDADQVELVTRTLIRQEAPFRVNAVGDGAGCLEALARETYGIVLLDYRLPRVSGLDVLREIRKREMRVPVVMVTGQGDERVAVEAMQAGASDYVIKSSGYLTTLPTVIRKVLKQHELALENARLYGEVQRRLSETEGLLAVATALGSSLDPREIATRTAQEVTALLGADCSLFLEAEEDGRRLRTVVLHSAREELAGIGTGIALEGDDLRRPVTGLDEPASGAAGHPAVRALPVRPAAFLYAPFLRQQQLLGAIVSYWWGPPAEPLEKPLVVALGVASQVALALDNARLYSEAQRSLTELKAAQEKLVQGATLRALGEMASGAAHHLNNLLMVILGRTDLLMRTAVAGTSRPKLEVIAQAAKDAAEVVRRVQRFARAEMMEERQLVDLTALARETLEITRPRWEDEAHARGAHFEVKLEAGTAAQVMGNPAALREVVMNLVLNAMDSLRGDGRIRVRTFAAGENACIEVADTGTGMSDDVKRRALEPFFTTKGPKGTGLGLSVSYGIIQSHGGELELRSALGEGTVATVRIPLAAGARTAQPAAAPEPAEKPDQHHVLIVDDDENVRSILVEMVASQGHGVLEAASGREAIRLLEGGASVDLVLTDLGMPGMSGWDVARAVRTRWPRLPVGLVTGWGNHLDAPAADRQLIVGTMAKPVSHERLAAFITSARGHRGLAPAI
jgi:signal transduction histidine kinase